MLNSEKIWQIQKKGSYIKHHHHHRRRTAGVLLRRHRRRSGINSVEIPPKTRYKQKQNETHYENIIH